MKKTHKVVMLPTEKASKIMFPTDLDKDYNRLHYNSKSLNVDGIHPQHLYIISDDEIKGTCWCYCTKENEIRLHQGASPAYEYAAYKKIIATTDKSLDRLCGCNINCGAELSNLPQLPESFIQAYIKAYNEGKPITEVDLEMVFNRAKAVDDTLEGMDFANPELGYEIKTRPDNTVICHTSKMYSRDEVEKLFNKYLEDSHNPKWSKYEGFDKWIQDNL